MAESGSTSVGEGRKKEDGFTSKRVVPEMLEMSLVFLAGCGLCHTHTTTTSTTGTRRNKVETNSQPSGWIAYVGILRVWGWTGSVRSYSGRELGPGLLGSLCLPSFPIHREVKMMSE